MNRTYQVTATNEDLCYHEGIEYVLATDIFHRYIYEDITKSWVIYFRFKIHPVLENFISRAVT